MSPSTILILIAALACPIAMGLMMWQMSKNMDDKSHHYMSGMDADHLKALHEQRRMLEQEIAEVEKIVELEEKKKSFAHTAAAESPAHEQ